MDNFWIINFNELIEFQVYKYVGCSHDNNDNEIIDESAIAR
jgi:hypothetical protein